MPERTTARGDPTKQFFVTMLVRDISLRDAIIDLLDNCVDGASALRGPADLSGLWAAIEFDRDHFEIHDNCGGIPIDTARNFAFRFGRPTEHVIEHNSIGRFGIGMKRALFKIGKKFRVESRTSASHFIVEQDLNDWLDEDSSWDFDFAAAEDGIRVAESEIGTEIGVTQLSPGVAVSLGNDSFFNSLVATIASTHADAISRGLRISVKGHTVGAEELTLFATNGFAPLRIEKTFDELQPPVRMRIIAGVSKRSLPDAGWYLFMNGREVLHADQTATTGWGERSEQRVPKFHEDFAYFRGYVWLWSEDAARLPWTTTKTAVDTDDDVYLAVRREMISCLDQIVPFLRKVEKERRELGDEAPVTASLAGLDPVPVSQAGAQERFSAPSTDTRPRTRSIQYRRPVEKVDRAKEILGASSNKEVGELTFDDWYDRHSND